MSRVYFNQMDSRWKNIMYSSVGNTNQTIGSSGCGPTSSAMVISSLTANIVYPNQMADWYVSAGYRSANNGTYFSAFQGTANRYGLDFKQTGDINVAVDCVRNGGMVVASTPGGSKNLFSTNGHYVVLVGISGDTFTVYDSYLYNGKYNSYGRETKASVSGNDVYVSIANVQNEIQQYFCFYPNSKTEIVTKSKYVKVNTALNVRSGPSTNDTVVMTLSNNTMVTVYEEQGGWSKIGEGKWVSSEYLSDSPSGTNVNTVMTVTANTGLNVRTEPNTSASIVTAYKKGTRVTIYEITNGWARGIKGWMYAKYLV